jgi:phosphatidylserine synthase
MPAPPAPAAASFPRASPLALLLDPSNLLTFLALAAGVAAVVAAVRHGDPAVTGLAMALAVLLDTFDGRFARRFARSPLQQAFGVQLDSLVDGVCAGVVPVVALAALTPAPAAGGAALWWAAACFYVACAVTRLGFYNLGSEGGGGFVGLPAPVPALLVATALLGSAGPLATGALMVVCGAAMVAPLRLRRPRGPGLALFAAWALALAAAHAYRALADLT